MHQAEPDLTGGSRCLCGAGPGTGHHPDDQTRDEQRAQRRIVVGRPGTPRTDGQHVPPGYRGPPGRGSFPCRPARWLLGAALAADPLVELRPIASLRGLAALLAADLADAPEVFLAVA